MRGHEACMHAKGIDGDRACVMMVMMARGKYERQSGGADVSQGPAEPTHQIARGSRARARSCARRGCAFAMPHWRLKVPLVREP